MRNQTIRVNIVNSEILKTKRATITKFMEVYAKSIDWAYSNPQAIEIFAKNMKVPPASPSRASTSTTPSRRCRSARSATSSARSRTRSTTSSSRRRRRPKDVEGLIDIVYKPAK